MGFMPKWKLWRVVSDLAKILIFLQWRLIPKMQRWCRMKTAGQSSCNSWELWMRVSIPSLESLSGVGERWLWAFHSTSCTEVGQDEEVQGKRATSNSTNRLASLAAVGWGEDPEQHCLLNLCGVTACRAPWQRCPGCWAVILLTLPPASVFLS